MVKVGGIYKHFKGNLYEVIAIAKDSETQKDVVVYKSIEDKQVWVRDLDMFMALVDKDKYPDVHQRYRFELND